MNWAGFRDIRTAITACPTCDNLQSPSVLDREMLSLVYVRFVEECSFNWDFTILQANSYYLSQLHRT